MTATAPTKDEIDRYMDLSVQGFDHEDAVEVIWPAPPEPKKPTVMVTEFPDGVVIGWDTCTLANNGCGKMVAKCQCKGGPKEPKVFAQWREGSKPMPDYAAAARSAQRQGIGSQDVDPANLTGVVVATGPSANEQREAAGIVRCVLGDHDTPKDQADQNDDKTWSCHACQEAGTQRPRSPQVDG